LTCFFADAVMGGKILGIWAGNANPNPAWRLQPP
jgi:hypothetical protein